VNIDLNTWGPLTVLAVIAGALLMVGGVVEVCTTPYTFGDFINDLKPVAAALGLGAAVGRGIHFGGASVAPTRKTRRTR
jgi:hypothetical protein